MPSSVLPAKAVQSTSSSGENDVSRGVFPAPQPAHVPPPSSKRISRKRDFYGSRSGYEEVGSVRGASGKADEGEASSEEESDDEEETAVVAGASGGELPTTASWPKELNDALLRGLALLPCIGRRKYRVDGQQLGRNGMLAEYIRRQTGKTRTKQEVRARVQQIRSNLSAELRLGWADDSLKGRDWSAILGQDFFPSTRKKGNPVNVRQTSSQPSANPSHSTKKPRLSAPSPRLSASSPRLSTAALPPPSAPQAPIAPPQPAPASYSLLPPSYSSPSDLAAFLTSFAPSHDFSLSSPILHSAGLASVDVLSSLLLVEQPTYRWVIEELVKSGRLDEVEGRWVEFAMAAAAKGLREGT